MPQRKLLLTVEETPTSSSSCVDEKLSRLSARPRVHMRIPLGLLLLAGLAGAQDYRRHTLNVDLGAALPRGELRSLFSDSFLAGIGYGFRFHEFFQADIGFDTAFGAADVQAYIPSYFGPLRIRDFQHFLPFGGRAILPLGSERVLLYGGGGGAYMRYSERIRQPVPDSGFRIDCAVCSSRHGVGYYGLVGVDFALDQAHQFRIGFGGRVIRGETEGDPIGAVPARQTKDHWINVFGRFSFSF
jgi:hypothetical protein